MVPGEAQNSKQGDAGTGRTEIDGAHGSSSGSKHSCSDRKPRTMSLTPLLPYVCLSWTTPVDLSLPPSHRDLSIHSLLLALPSSCCFPWSLCLIVLSSLVRFSSISSNNHTNTSFKQFLQTRCVRRQLHAYANGHDREQAKQREETK